MKKRTDKTDKYKKIEEIVVNLAGKRLPEAKIVAVEIAEDVDHEGDEILRVGLIYDSGKRKIKSRGGRLGFEWRLGEKLSEIGIKAFPLMSYMEADDPDIGWWRARFEQKRTGVAA